MRHKTFWLLVTALLFLGAVFCILIAKTNTFSSDLSQPKDSRQ